MTTDKSQEKIADLRALAIEALPRMYRPNERMYAFRLRNRDGRDVLEGVSRRYTAIVLIALAEEPDEVRSAALPGITADDQCARLIADLDAMEDFGEVALTAWAARALNHAGSEQALARVREMDPVMGDYPTVETSWALTALSVPSDRKSDEKLAKQIADRLLRTFQPPGSLFSHYPSGANRPWLRGHVCCFADLVYPIQGLSYYAMATGDEQARMAARQCADHMVATQGKQGQWWWHFDVRSGKVVEGYPVYAVHQDSMAPMALLAAMQAGSRDYRAAIGNGFDWLYSAPEIAGSLIDRTNDVIWRKVARKEPSKMTRKIQAVSSRVHPAVRMPGVNLVFQPGAIDAESRPYHMGWILYAFNGARYQQLIQD